MMPRAEANSPGAGDGHSGGSSAGPQPRPRIVRQGRHAILYDAELLPRPPDPEWFTPAWWYARDGVDGVAGGRGETLLVAHDAQRWVLKHYRRGGWAARFSSDGYLWLGAERSRAFREWRMLARLSRQGLQVPRPVAAHCQRRGMSCRADLITELIEVGEPLSAVLRRGPMPRRRWLDVGAAIRRLHGAGIWHADLNAHNILLAAAPDAAAAVYLIDFDRARERHGSRWRAANLRRLRRSLHKIARHDSAVAVDDADWAALLAGYDEGKR